MAIGSLPWRQESGESVAPRRASGSVVPFFKMLLRPFASLKLTVGLFAASIFLVFVGTLAQVDKDMWEVMGEYFYSYFAWVEFQVFFPRSWFPNWQNVRGGIYFPGGLLIGILLFVNLLAAHLVRFTIQARGVRLGSGLAVTLVGAILTALVILSGHNHEGLQGAPPFSWPTLWLIIKLSLLPLWLASLAGTVWVVSGGRGPVEAGLALCGAGLLTVVVGWVWLGGQQAYLGDAGMRILWQLIQGGLAALVLLAGCMLAFKKRGGIVLIHGGVGLLMLGQLFVSTYDKEEQITLVEGEQVRFARDIRSVELAVIDRADAGSDKVVAIPLTIKGKRTQRLETGITHPELPFDIRVEEYYRNSDLRSVAPDDKNLATQGEGRFVMAVERRGSGGASSDSAVDMAAAYVSFLKKGSGEKLGTWLLVQEADVPERVTVEGRTYDVFLRFSRAYKPYTVELLDVRKDDYVGTDTPRNYSSDVRLVDASRGVDTEAHIWMNNPLRYAGETFYQSGYRKLEDGSEVTTLQVVRNTGWMVPYVACMLVGVGMLAHFSMVLVRFLRRLAAGPPPASAGAAPPGEPGRESRKAAKAQRRRGDRASMLAADSGFARWLPWALVAIVALYAVGKLAPRSTPEGEMDLAAFGRLPLLYQGRAKPFDTLARNSLRVISDRETFVDDQDQKQPAIRWLLDVISGSEAAEEHRVFRIASLEVLDIFGLQRRPGFRYSAAELRPKIAEYEQEVHRAREMAREKGPESLDIRQKKVLELDERIRVYTMLLASFQRPPLPPLPTPEEFEKDRDLAHRKVEAFQNAVARTLGQLSSIHPPLAVPVEAPPDDSASETGRTEWLPYARAWTLAYVQQRLIGQAPDPATISLESILAAYAQGDVKAFNKAVRSYQNDLAGDPPAEINLAKLRFEAAFNRVAPFTLANVIYLMVFIFAALGLLGWVIGWQRPLNRTAFGLAVLALVIHTGALAARVYISGRPPVTNLYSSAVYIGWACVVFGLVLELIFRLGLGNLVGAVAGFGTLLVAQFLSGDGDTFTVLQAVLDTQFWLATHVVCITTGYATTFVAGLLGIAYILGGLLTPALSAQWNGKHLGKLLATMTYGVVCFSLFFSFIGTVLGGLWADDSWGRFWGWDPKENGALIIVLWNALILHARWGGMVKDRGFAVLAVAGNIVTSWSWFGVNELGVGLHSYGFTEGVLYSLGLFVLSQLAIILVGALVPLRDWISFRGGKGAALAAAE